MNARHVLAELAADPERVEQVPAADLPALLEAVEGLKARLWLRLTRPEPNGNGRKGEAEPDRLLTVEDVAEILSADVRYVYDHADGWPFTRRPSPRTLRFSERALYRWLERQP